MMKVSFASLSKESVEDLEAMITRLDITRMDWRCYEGSLLGPRDLTLVCGRT
jgi:hypothetical protein